MRFLPPANFIEAKLPEWAVLGKNPPAFTSPRKAPTGRRKLGRIYEAAVQSRLLEEFPFYVDGPWIKFGESGAVRWCQPDGILFDFESGTVTVVEVKLAHTSAAWWQLRKLYIPVLKRIFPTSLWKYRAVEIVKFFDCDTNFPEPIRLLKNLREGQSLDHNEMGVFIWKL